MRFGSQVYEGFSRVGGGGNNEVGREGNRRGQGSGHMKDRDADAEAEEQRSRGNERAGEQKHPSRIQVLVLLDRRNGT